MIEIENVTLNTKIDNDEKISVDVKILKYFCLNENSLSIPGWIAASFSEPLHVGNVVKQCKKLSESGILKGEIVYAKGHGGGPKQAYKLNLTFENLEYLVLKLPIDDIARLMKAPDYLKLLPDVIRYFEINLQNQNIDSLTSEAKTYIEDFLKLSPSCLKFILNSGEYKNVARQQDNLKSNSLNMGISSPRNREVYKGRSFMKITCGLAYYDCMKGAINSDEPDYIGKIVSSHLPTTLKLFVHSMLD